jgi:hypothetical protein
MVKIIALRKECGREWDADASQYDEHYEPLEPGHWLVRPCDGTPVYVTTMDDMPGHWIEQIREFRRLLGKLP